MNNNFDYAKHIVNDYTKQYQQHPYASIIYKSAEHYFEDHLLMITMNVHRWAQYPVDNPLNVFGIWYFRLMKAVLGRNVGSQLDLQPRTYAFIDFEGSRTGLHSMQRPHVHALMLLPMDDASRFRNALMLDRTTLFDMSEVADVMVEQFRRSEKSPYYVATYVTKGHTRCVETLGCRDDLWMIFPNTSKSNPEEAAR